MKTLFKNLVLCLFVLCFGFILSCDLTEPNETFYNHNAKPPDVFALDIQQIRPGQYVAGRVLFTFNPAIPPQDIRSIVLVVDDSIASTAYASPYEFELDTRLWPEGPHLLSVGVFKNTSPELGLLNFLGAPSMVYSASVVFDQRPPTPVVLDSVVWENVSRSPLLSWRQNNDSNFYAYIISKEGNFGLNNPNVVGAGIDSVFDRAITSYLDTSAHQMFGINIKYQVNVTNRDVMVLSNLDTIHFGQTISVSPGSNVGYLVRPIRSSLRDEIYVLENGVVKAVSTLDNSITRSFSMGNYPLNFALSRDNSRLYIVSTYSPKLTVLDAGNFNIVMTTDFSFNPSSVACGRPNRLYLTTSFPFNGSVKIVDANSGAEIGGLGVTAPNGLLAVSSDNNTIYVADTRAELFAPANVFKIDITTDSAQVLLQRRASDVVRQIQLSFDDQQLYVVHDNDYPAPPNNFVDIWNTSNLVSINHINTPDRVYDFIETSSSIYIAYSIPGGRYFQAGRVVEYDIPSFGAHASWDFVQVPQVTQVSRDNHYLYAFAFESWIVPLHP